MDLDEIARDLAAYVKGASLVTAQAVGAVDGYQNSEKQASALTDALVPAMVAQGLVDAADEPVVRQLMGSHAGAVQMCKFAVNALAAARKQLATVTGGAIDKQAADGAAGDPLDTGKPAPAAGARLSPVDAALASIVQHP